MQLDSKVILGRLYECTGQKGGQYFGGRLGAARIMLFRDDYADDDNVWQLFVQSFRTAVKKALSWPRNAKAQQKKIEVPGAGRRPPAGRKRPRNSNCLLMTRYRTYWHEGPHGT